MEHKVVVGKYSYTLRDSAYSRGHEYEVLHHYSTKKAVAKRMADKLKKRTGNSFILKKYPANETKSGAPFLYVVCGR